jgi:hypothetical protein
MQSCAGVTDLEHFEVEPSHCVAVQLAAARFL